MPFSERVEYITTSRTPSMKGVAFPVVLGAGGFFTRTDGMETILGGLKQLLLTNRGERVMRPDFGTSLRKACFQQADKDLENSLKHEIDSVIARYEPRVYLKNLKISVDESIGNVDYNRVLITCLIALKGDTLRERILEIIV
jgi:hypothetical protein